MLIDTGARRKAMISDSLARKLGIMNLEKCDILLSGANRAQLEVLGKCKINLQLECGVQGRIITNKSKLRKICRTKAEAGDVQRSVLNSTKLGETHYCVNQLECVVVKDLAKPLILGMQFIDEHEMIVNGKTKVIQVGNCVIQPHCRKESCKQTVVRPNRDKGYIYLLTDVVLDAH